jgi:radical SAM superfamily enzyme YgiQ (UPF0313 family)
MMTKLDVLVINPSAIDQIYQSLSREYAAIEPPIWAGLIANFLRKQNRSVEILDAEAEWLTPEQAARKAVEANAKLIAIIVYGQQPSASTQNMYGAGLTCNAIKALQPDAKIILVGGHVSALPKRTMEEEKTDFVAVGEGPLTIQALLESGLNGSSQYDKVPGLWYRHGDEIKFGPPAPVIPQESLATTMPGIAWDLLPMKNYRAHNWHSFDRIDERQPYASIYTSLGCPFRCTFCCINAPFGKSSFRYWDPEFMIGQFDLLATKYNIRNIKIADEMFVLHEKHFLKLCELLAARNHGFNIWAYARVDTVKPHFLATMKKAGVNWLALGIESSSKFVRNGVAKGRFDETDIHAVVSMIKDAGINVHGNYIFGLPDDDLESMQKNLEMAIDLNCEMSNFYSAMAYPGSQLYQMALDNNWKLPDSWLGYSQHAVDSLPLPTKHLSAGEVLAFRDAAWTKYYTNPKYLKLVSERFGPKTLEHIERLSKVRLDRKYAEYGKTAKP